ncbi:MAG TPA: hypothetical protein VM597_33405 [Gemmataceae bacterium]|nr:hypothetical protein [Gemmataceae bacterium]
MFQAKLRGWRRLAAGLVLVPGLTGLGADALGLLGRAAGQDRPAADARELTRQARAALDAGDKEKARELAEKARTLRAQGAFYDESPDDVLADLPAKAGKGADKPTTTDPKVLLEMAKQAHSVGDLDKAQDLATQAQAHSAAVRWGLFDDTPASVLKDVQKAKGKRDQATAERLLADARTLVAKQAATKEERAANLMAAEEKAKQSARLHGEYSVWDFGDRPADVVADVRKAREREKISPTYRPTVGSRNMDAGGSKATDPVASGPARMPGRAPAEDRGTRYGETKRPAADAGDALSRKKMAIGLMQESMALRLSGNYVDARKKLVEADKLNAWFGKDDDTPAVLLAQLNVAAQKKVNVLTAEAKSCLARKDETAARTMLDEAHALATGMGLDAAEVADVRVALKPVKEDTVIRTASRGTRDELVADLPPAVKPPESEEPPYHPVKAPKKPDTAPLLPALPGELPEPPMPLKGAEPVKMPEIKSAADPVKMPEIKSADPVKLPEPPMPVIKSGKDKGDATAAQAPDLILPDVKAPAGKPDVKLPADPTLVDRAPDFGKPPELPAPPMPDKGEELLKQARVEKAAGNLESARKLVTEILSGDYSNKDAASKLLTSIDTEEAARKIESAKKAFANGMDLYHAHNYAGALSVFNQIDGTLLIKADRTKLADMIGQATAKMQAAKEAAKPADVELPPMPGPMTTPPAPTRPTARVVEEIPGAPVPAPRVGADNLIQQKQALAQVEFQKLRSKALKIEGDATARFGRGETDAALQDLQNFIAEVKGTSLDASKQNLLCRPIEARMDRLRILKHQTDFLTKEARDRRNFSSEMAQEVLGKQKKQEEVMALVKQATKLQDEAKYKESYAKLQMAHSLEPDDAAINAAMQTAKTLMRRELFQNAKASQEEWNFHAGNELFEYPTVNGKDPLKMPTDPEALKRYMQRKELRTGTMRSLTEGDKAIQRKMSTPVDVNFKAMSLEGVVEHLQTMTNINFNLDLKGLKEANIDPKHPVSATLKNVSLKSALNIVCQQVGLKHVIEDEAIRITTAKNAAGRQVTRTLSVGDLVVPAPNYGAHPGMTFHESMKAARDAAYGPTGAGAAGGTATIRNAALPGGAGVGSGSNDLPGMPNRLKTSGAPRDGGFNTNGSNSPGTLERELIRLITSTIKPDSWRDMGGEGSVEYFPLGLALVINQSPEVIEEVERLLESLRKVQDLEVSIEVKVVSLGETFFERIGVDFSMGIPTNAGPNGGPNTGESTVPGLNGGLNSRNFSGNVLGLQTPRQPTPDLDIPIRATSFGRAIPPFGGFGNSFADGGISLGLAFLSDIQVQMFLEAAQGDTRTNVMQAPKVTALNGTAATINVGDYQFFLTGITVANVAGELVFVPQNVPYIVGLAQPIPPNASIQNGLLNFTPTQPQTPGLYLAVQPVVSADRRFVRLNIQQSFTNLISGTQQIPITTIVQAQFANGGIGQPVPFTQYLQQPRFSNLEAQTVVVVPDGGTVVMGGLKYLTEGRNEFGPPVLSKIPYLNRLFKNVAYGREGRSILIMVTPRVIINREEQERQTGVSEDQAIGLLGAGGF